MYIAIALLRILYLPTMKTCCSIIFLDRPLLIPASSPASPLSIFDFNWAKHIRAKYFLHLWFDERTETSRTTVTHSIAWSQKIPPVKDSRNFLMSSFMIYAHELTISPHRPPKATRELIILPLRPVIEPQFCHWFFFSQTLAFARRSTDLFAF